MDQLDEIDQKILQFLQEDSRIAYTKIAEKLQIPDTTVHFRIKKMKSSNLIKKFTILISSESFGYNQGALFKIKIGDHIVKDISIKRTEEIGKTYAEKSNFCFLGTAEEGTTLFGLIFVKDEDELQELTSEIRNDPDIVDVEIIRFTKIIKGTDLFGLNLFKEVEL